jgi:hypothetical protein
LKYPKPAGAIGNSTDTRRCLSVTRRHRAARHSASSIHISRARKSPRVIGGVAALRLDRLERRLRPPIRRAPLPSWLRQSVVWGACRPWSECDPTGLIFKPVILPQSNRPTTPTTQAANKDRSECHRLSSERLGLSR